jgi:Zn-dependent protease with chaperone function
VPATGAPAELTTFADQIEIRSGEVNARARMSELRVREVGFGKQMGFELAWDTPDGTQAVHVMDPQAVAQLCAWPCFAESDELRTLKSAVRGRAARRSAGWLALIFFLSLPLLLILVFVWQADRIAGALAARIPIEQEVALGKQGFASLRASLELQDGGPAYEAVNALGARLAQGSKYTYQFHVAKDDSINAFAMPGGIIVVHTGLIAATQRPEELAGVLAHEIQHVELRHSLKGAFKQLGLRGLWALVTGDLGSGLIGQAAFQLTSLRFSRSDESNADAKGVEALIEHNIDPQGMVDFFATMEKKNGVQPPAFLSTHPADQKRQEALLRRLESIEKRSYEPLQMGAWPPVDP